MFCHFTSLAQTNVEEEKSSCSKALKEAQKDYEKGNIEKIAAKIEPCSNSEEFDKIEKMQAYRLLILTYLFLDDQKNADKWMYNLLKLEPDYKPNPLIDPIEYVKLYKSFRVVPWLSFGTFFGLNRSSVASKHAYSLNNSEDQPTTYKPGVGIQLGFLADFNIKKNIFLTTEILLSTRSFSSNTDVLFDSYNVSNESSTWLEIPVSVKYIFLNKKIKPYIRAGSTLMWQTGTVSQIERFNKTSDQVELTGPAIDLTTQRSDLNFNVFAGGGIMYKMGYGNLFLDARYTLGFTNFVNQAERYTKMAELISTYGYLPDDFTLNTIQVCLGYSYSFFKVKKNKTKFIVEE